MAPDRVCPHGLMAKECPTCRAEAEAEREAVLASFGTDRASMRVLERENVSLHAQLQEIGFERDGLRVTLEARRAEVGSLKALLLRAKFRLRGLDPETPMSEGQARQWYAATDAFLAEIDAALEVKRDG